MRKSKISGGIYFISVALGIGSSFMAHISALLGASSGWLIHIFALMMCIPPLIFSRCACKEAGVGNCFDVLRENEWIYNVVKGILGVSFFVLAILVCSHFSYILNGWVLQNVSSIKISGGLCVFLYITLFKEKKSIYYAVVVVSILCILSVLALRLGTVFTGKLEKIMPFFEKERFGLDMLRGTIYSFGVFATAFLCTEIYKKSISGTEYIIGISGTMILFVLSVFSCSMLLGVTQTAESFDAIILAMRKSNVLGRGDIVFFSVWMFLIAGAFCSIGFAPIAIFKDEGSKIRKNNTAVINAVYCIAIFALSNLLGKYINQINGLVLFMTVVCGSMLYSLSFISFIVCKTKKGGNEDEN